MRRLRLAVCVLATAILASSASGAETRRQLSDYTGGHGPGAETVAIIGDIPYGDDLIAEFPQDVREINADPAVRRVVHLGDIKNGSSRCDTTYFEARLAEFETFADPLVYTPGDNEWTDCHRANNGAYNPVERLSTLRRLFFSRPGRTLGGRAAVDVQSRRFPENVRWTQAGVQFGVVHVVGSNDDQLPWFGDRVDATGAPAPETGVERAQRAREYTARGAASLEWVDAIFDRAERRDAAGVVLGMQADMYDASAQLSAFAGLKAVIADRAERFGKPVLLLEGDSHLFLIDKPADMPSNLTRVVVEGSTNLPHEWLRLKVDPKTPQVFSCENVEFLTKKVTACPAPLAP